MEAIKFKTLTDTTEIDFFLSRFESFVGVKLPYDYMERSQFVAGHDGN